MVPDPDEHGPAFRCAVAAAAPSTLLSCWISYRSPADREWARLVSSSITFVARWATKTDPGYRPCELYVVKDDGGTYSRSFGLDVPDGEQIEESVPVPADRITDAWITCTELQEVE
jgi:hypothetical protein